MIQFECDYTNEHIKFLYNNFIKASLKGVILINLIFIPLIVFIKNIFKEPILLLFLVIPISFFLLLLDQLTFSRKEIIKNNTPKKIFIDEKGGILVKYLNNEIYKSIDDIRMIEKCEKDFLIHFYLPFNLKIIIQKNMITQGTIEEFEKLFIDKIIK